MDNKRRARTMDYKRAKKMDNKCKAVQVWSFLAILSFPEMNLICMNKDMWQHPIVDVNETISFGSKIANKQVNLCPLKSGGMKFPKYFSILIGGCK